MYNKLVAGRDAKVKTGQILTIETLSSGTKEDAVRALQQQVA